MHTMTRTVRLLTLLAALACSPVSAAGETWAPDGTPDPKSVTLGGGITYTPPEAAAPEPDPGAPQDPPGEEVDPFAYRVPTSEEGEYIPTTRAKVPAGIRILSIMHVRGAEPMAAIHIPSAAGGDMHFVRAGDVVQINLAPQLLVTQRTQTQTARGRRGRTTETETKESATTSGSSVPDYFYLRVMRITRDFVEIAPRARPQDTVILR